MSEEVTTRIFSEVFASELVADPIVFLWHLGEPLAVPPEFYRNAFDSCARLNIQNRGYTHSFQTNATLINGQWVDLIKAYDVRIGLSLDGPAFIHDQQRKDKKGRGTHHQVMRGIRILQDSGIAFSVIMVVTAYSLDYADELCDFFLENNIKEVGFNIDEIEGIHTDSSFVNDGLEERYKSFFRRLADRSAESSGNLKIREIWTSLRNITNSDSEPYNTTNQPFHIFNFDCDGNISTFCPELVAAKSERHGDFVMGNIMTDSLDAIVNNCVFQAVNTEIQAGVDACRKTCEYWRFCGGGSPSNKFFEHGRFDITETMACRVHKKLTVDVLLDFFEARLHLLPNLSAS
jgi:uncharacterized protein